LRDSYEYADYYRAFTHAFTEWSSISRNYFGTYVDLRSACGLSHAEIGKQVSIWIHNYPGTYFIDDVSNMDGNVQNAHLYPHYALYDNICPQMAKHARAAHRFTGFVKMKTALQIVVYGCEATVKSGAQDTSSGQTSRRIDSFVRCLYGLGVTVIVGYAFGDDLWIIMLGNLPTLEQLQILQAACGWKTKGVYLFDPTHTDFLCCGFVPDVQNDYAMVPLIGKQLAKLFWTWRRIPNSRRGSYVHQVAESMIPRYAGFKFVIAWLKWHLAVPCKKPYRLPLDFVPQPAHHCALRWADFVMRRYGLPLPSQEDIDCFTRVPPSATAVLYNQWALSVMEHDLADPAARPNTNLC
jgi:hypothetical protein